MLDSSVLAVLPHWVWRTHDEGLVMRWISFLAFACVFWSSSESAPQSPGPLPAHVNSLEMCSLEKPTPQRFQIGPPMGTGDSASDEKLDQLRVTPVGSQLIVSGAGIIALVAAPSAGRGGGSIEGVTRARNGGDLVAAPPNPGQARAWEICLGTRRTNPDSCNPEGSWRDNRNMNSSWQVVDGPGEPAVRFRWVDEKLGLDVVQTLVLDRRGLRARLTVRSSGLLASIVAVRFPMVNINYGGSDASLAELVLPRGNLGTLCRNCSGSQAMYPSMYQTMPWFGVLEGAYGLYVGAHDPSGSIKRVVASGPKAPGPSYFEIYPEDSGAYGNSVEPDWYFEIAPICANRGWPALAHHYKEWVGAETEWGRATRLIDRVDLPRDVLDGAWWFSHSIVPKDGIEVLERQTRDNRKDFPDVPTVHHWYEWHMPGMDRGFPTHSPKPGAKEAIERLQSDPRTRILLYTNATHSDQSSAPLETGRPYCPNGASQYPKYWHEALQRPDGTRIFGVPSSNACLVAMDLTSEIWRFAVISNSQLVTKQLGAAGVYLDVVGNVIEGSWYPIRHAAGRGAWVTRSARDLVRAISKTDPFVVVEGSLEQLAGISAVGVNYLPSTIDMIPIFPLVYHERFVLAGMHSLPPDDQDALRIKNGLAFAWGLQLGLNSLQWHKPERLLNIEWAGQLVRTRREWANWLAYGEYLGPVDFADVSESDMVESKSWAGPEANLPTLVFRRKPIEASLFKGADGRYSTILVNLGRKRIVARLKLPAPFERAKVRMEYRPGRGLGASTLEPVNGILTIELSPGQIAKGDVVMSEPN